MNTSKSGHKVYLGDAVYADWNGHQVVLTTEYGRGAEYVSNTIYLEQEVLDALNRYVERLSKQLIEQAKEDVKR